MKSGTIHTNKYDIFISYRRSSYDVANLIATRLASAGYSVFFDMEKLRSGKFNEQLYDVIENCKDFVIVLPPNALDRCVSEDDWVRLEVMHAMNTNKNIIPVMLNGFAWPNQMPQGMEELRNYQALTASSVEYFDLAMEKLQKRYLLSKRHLPINRLIKYACIAIMSLLAFVAILFGVFTLLSRDVCKKYATCLTMDASNVHIIAEENHKLEQSWKTFDNMLDYEHNPEHIMYSQEEMLSKIDVVEKNIRETWNVDSVPMEINPYHGFLLSLHGISSEDISQSPALATLYYTDYQNMLNTIRTAVLEPSTINRRLATVLFEVTGHSINEYYLSILCELSEFPEYSRDLYNKLNEEWLYFPIRYYKIDESREYYESRMRTESRLADEALSRYSSFLERADTELLDLQKENDRLEMQMIEGFAQLEARADTLEAVLDAKRNTTDADKEMRHELALREEKVKANEIVVNTLKDELIELDRQYTQVYDQLKEKCTLEEEDDQWYKWDKIRRWGTFLDILVESRQDMKDMNIHTTSSITPEVAYADMNSMLTVYQTYHPESKEYVASAKQFFRELTKEKRQYAGILVFAIKDDAEHPVFKKGDIIIGYDGKPIKDLDEFKVAYKAYENGKVAFLRLADGNFVEHKKQIADTDIVGFLDLTE